MLLLTLAVCGAITVRRSWKIEKVINPLWGFALVYAAFAIPAPLNIGHRHILPIYPALFVACGAVVHLLRKNRIFATAIAVLLIAQIADSVAARPDYLPYFNQLAAGPGRGYEHLVDSSLDWGQDLPGLNRWIENHRTVDDRTPIYLAYFGTADPRWYAVNAEMILPENQFSTTPSHLTRGTYCISATLLQSVYINDLGQWCAPYEQRYQSALAEMNRDRETDVARISNDQPRAAKMTTEFEWLRLERLCAYLRHKRPVAQVGHSIFVFDLDESDVSHALYGPPVELTANIRVNGL